MYLALILFYANAIVIHVIHELLNATERQYYISTYNWFKNYFSLERSCNRTIDRFKCVSI